MIDIKITSEGDIQVDSASGDIQLTGSLNPPSDKDAATFIAQISSCALKTERGDYLIQPQLGSELNKLIGYANKPATAAAGERFIKDALKSYGIVAKTKIESWPVDHNTIGYEVRIQIGTTSKELAFTLSQAIATVFPE